MNSPKADLDIHHLKLQTDITQYQSVHTGIAEEHHVNRSSESTRIALDKTGASINVRDRYLQSLCSGTYWLHKSAAKEVGGPSGEVVDSPKFDLSGITCLGSGRSILVAYQVTMSASSDNADGSLLEYADSRGLFLVRVVDWKKWHRFDQTRGLEEHETVLRPIVRSATDCFAYGLKQGSEVYESISELARKERGRHRIDLSGDPISGREFFWNASSGKRGTVAVVVPSDKFPVEVFSHCKYASVMTNPSVGHTPGAFRFAQSCANETDSVVVCFPRNNGFEWMDIFAGKGKTSALFRKALDACSQGA